MTAARLKFDVGGAEGSDEMHEPAHEETTRVEGQSVSNATAAAGGDSPDAAAGAEVPMAQVAVAAVAAPRFCRACGAAWQEGWQDCPVCVGARGAAGAIDSTNDSGDIGSVKKAVGLYFALLAVCAVGLVTSYADAYTLGVEVGLTIAISVVVLIWAMYSWREVLPPLQRAPGLGWMAASAAIGVGTFAVAMGFIGGLQFMLDLPEEYASDQFLEAGYGWGAVLLATAVQPAVFEEVAFRGVINSALSRVLGAGETIAVGAMMFMILHLAPARFPHTLAMGVAAGFLRLRTGSLYPCILLHFVHNSLCVGVEYMEWM